MKTIVGFTKRHKILVSVVTLVLLIGIVGFKLRMIRAAEDILSPPISKGSIIESVYGIGTVAANHSYQVKAGVTSTVRRLFVKEGDSVKKGQSLVDIDGTILTAPFNGTITSLPLKTGETVFAQSPIMTLVDLLDRYLTVSLEQQGAIRVRSGQKAKVNFDSMRDETYEGVVEAIYSRDTNFLVRIRVDGLPSQILPGMSADVAIGINEHKDVLLVPVAAIHQSEVRVKNGRGPFKRVAIKTGIIDGALAEVFTSELKEGDRLMIQKRITQ